MLSSWDDPGPVGPGRRLPARRRSARLQPGPAVGRPDGVQEPGGIVSAGKRDLTQSTGTHTLVPRRIRRPSGTKDFTGIFMAGGTIRRDLAAVDWAATPLGPPEGWPHALNAAVQTMLGSRFAMWMAWGPELTFFCNEAYRRDTLGSQYPWALGRPASEVWAEIWPEIGPRIDQVIRTGEATWDEVGVRGLRAQADRLRAPPSRARPGRPRDVGQDRVQPAVERAQVHLRPGCAGCRRTPPAGVGFSWSTCSATPGATRSTAAARPSGSP